MNWKGNGSDSLEISSFDKVLPLKNGAKRADQGDAERLLPVDTVLC